MSTYEPLPGRNYLPGGIGNLDIVLLRLSHKFVKDMHWAFPLRDIAQGTSFFKIP